MRSPCATCCMDLQCCNSHQETIWLLHCRPQSLTGVSDGWQHSLAAPALLLQQQHASARPCLCCRLEDFTPQGLAMSIWALTGLQVRGRQLSLVPRSSACTRASLASAVPHVERCPRLAECGHVPCGCAPAGPRRGAVGGAGSRLQSYRHLQPAGGSHCSSSGQWCCGEKRTACF